MLDCKRNVAVCGKIVSDNISASALLVSSKGNHPDAKSSNPKNMKTPLTADIEFFQYFFSKSEIIRNRMIKTPTHLLGHGNKSRRRCSSIVDASLASLKFSSDFDRVNRWANGM